MAPANGRSAPSPDEATALVSQEDSRRTEFAFRAVSATRSYEEVVRQVERAIRTSHLHRGQRLPTERQLAETFGVSRGVIREAVKVLGAMGLVEARQGSGLYVQNDTIPTVTRAFILSVSPDTESIERLFEFSRGLESDAARFAAHRRGPLHLEEMRKTIEAIERATDPIDWNLFAACDNAFHKAIAQASANPYLEVAIATARDMQRDVVNLVADRAGSIRAAIAHHRSVLDAIERRDADSAARTMADHIAYTADAVQSKIPLSTPVVDDRNGTGDVNS